MLTKKWQPITWSDSVELPCAAQNNRALRNSLRSNSPRANPVIFALLGCVKWRQEHLRHYVIQMTLSGPTYNPPLLWVVVKFCRLFSLRNLTFRRACHLFFRRLEPEYTGPSDATAIQAVPGQSAGTSGSSPREPRGRKVW